jgi:hypothetical protein
MPTSNPTRDVSGQRTGDAEIFIPVNNVIESEHGRLKARLRPMRGLKRLPSARTISAGQAFVQNLRPGHYAITADLPVHHRVHVAFHELALSL